MHRTALTERITRPRMSTGLRPNNPDFSRSHCMDELAEVQSSYVICPVTHRKEGSGQGFGQKACPTTLLSLPLVDHMMLAPWKKSYDQPRQHIEKQRHYFANKGPSSQSYGFLVVMDGCEIWAIKKAESCRIDAFGLQCWRRLLRVPLGLQEDQS